MRLIFMCYVQHTTGEFGTTYITWILPVLVVPVYYETYPFPGKV